MIHRAPKVNTETETWNRLFRYISPFLREHASDCHRAGVRQLGLHADVLPDFRSFRDSVRKETGWTIVEADGELGDFEFFQELAEKRFPVVRKMRPLEQLYGGIDPDFWHEAFGHIPPLTESSVSELYQWFGRAGVYAATHGDGVTLKGLAKLYWSIAEYGFLAEDGKSKLFGAALLGSPLAVERFRAGKIRTKRFSIREVLSSDFDPHRYQPFYFVMESVEETLKEIRRWYPHVEGR